MRSCIMLAGRHCGMLDNDASASWGMSCVETAVVFADCRNVQTLRLDRYNVDPCDRPVRLLPSEHELGYFMTSCRGICDNAISP